MLKIYLRCSLWLVSFRSRRIYFESSESTQESITGYLESVVSCSLRSGFVTACVRSNPPKFVVNKVICRRDGSPRGCLVVIHEKAGLPITINYLYRPARCPDVPPGDLQMIIINTNIFTRPFITLCTI
jgi:hypothetical protein